MTTPITIRPATAADQSELARLGLHVQNDHAAAHPKVFRPNVTPLGEAHVTRLLADDRSALLVAEQDGTVHGCVVVHVRQAPDYVVFWPRTFAKVDTLVVGPARRESGVGRRLMEAAAKWATQQGATSLELDVWESNTAAVAFYEHLGLQTTRRVMSMPLDASSSGAGDVGEAATRWPGDAPAQT